MREASPINVQMTLMRLCGAGGGGGGGGTRGVGAPLAIGTNSSVPASPCSGVGVIAAGSPELSAPSSSLTSPPTREHSDPTCTAATHHATMVNCSDTK
jgi:hypothetical protein